jgi:hypothetical protein
MKPGLSYIVVLLIIQSLFIGSLVNPELQNEFLGKWKETTHIQKNGVPDTYIIPFRVGINHSFLKRNYCIPFQFNNILTHRSNSIAAFVVEISYTSQSRINFSSAPIYLLTGTLRI